MDRPPSIMNTLPMAQGYHHPHHRRLAPPRQAYDGPPLSPRQAAYMATPSPPPLSPSPLGSPLSRQSSFRSGSLGVLSTPAIEPDNPPVSTENEEEHVDLGSPEPDADAEAEAERRRKAKALDDTAPLYAAIERLAKTCHEHELRFRSSKASFEHRVFSEYPTIIDKLVELDMRAERSTAELSQVINHAGPELKARLERVLDERRANVETMRTRTTPWVAFLPEDEGTEPGESSAAGSTSVGADEKRAPAAMVRRESGKIERVKGATASNEASDALAMIERWAEEVKMKLADEIGRLRTQLGEERRKNHIVTRLLVLLMFCGALLAVFYLLANGRGKAKV